MAHDPPYSTGIFETIVDVHFGGLAVEFKDSSGKSMLELSGGIPDFDKGIISVWFRVPGSSLVKGFSRNSGPLRRVVPVMTFGRIYDSYRVEQELGPSVSRTSTAYGRGSDCAVSGVPTPFSVYAGPTLTTIPEVSDPSYIGLYLNDDFGNSDVKATLAIRLQVNNIGSGVWVNTRPTFDESDYGTLIFDSCPGGATDTAWDYGLLECRTEGVIPGTEHQRTFGRVDETELYSKNETTDVFESVTEKIAVSPNHWHHALISFDLSKQSTGVGEYATLIYPPDCSGGYTPTVEVDSRRRISDPCKLWVAFDDVNQIGDKINDGTAGLGANGIASNNVVLAAETTFATSTEQRAWGVTGEVVVDTSEQGGMPTYTYSPGVIPSSGFPLGIPVISALADAMVDIEMAEMQVFRGKTLNTASKAARRLFVDDRGKPVPMAVAAKALGKPVLALHGTKRWQTGDNTGTPPTSLTPINEIVLYRPDPSLRGPQGDPQ